MVRLLLGNLSIMGPKARDCPDIWNDLRFFGLVLTPNKKSGVNFAYQSVFIRFQPPQRRAQMWRSRRTRGR
jgi:hypothetical protein